MIYNGENTYLPLDEFRRSSSIFTLDMNNRFIRSLPRPAQMHAPSIEEWIRNYSRRVDHSIPRACADLQRFVIDDDFFGLLKFSYNLSVLLYLIDQEEEGASIEAITMICKQLIREDARRK